MKKVVALIGRISSGKDYAGDFLEQKLGIKHVGISSSLRIIARDRGIKETRENLISIGRELATDYGDGYLAEILVTRETDDILVISGPRQLGQLEYLKENTYCLFVAVESDEKIRYKRMLERGKIGEDVTFERFRDVEKMEEGGIQDVGKCMSICDITIKNNGSLEQFEKSILEAITDFKLFP